MGHRMNITFLPLSSTFLFLKLNQKSPLSTLLCLDRLKFAVKSLQSALLHLDVLKFAQFKIYST